MDGFHERLVVRAATIDELLSDDFEPLTGAAGDAALAARRIDAWCRSSAGGDRSLFARRLERDGLSIDTVTARLAGARRNKDSARPVWLDDVLWIEAALQSPAKPSAPPREPCAFEHVLLPVVEQAAALLWADIDARATATLNDNARACLVYMLLKALSGLAAPAIYERFSKARKQAAAPDAGKAGAARYDQFVADMKARGLRAMFEEKPVLLRLIATLTRQWIDTSREFVERLAANAAAIHQNLLPAEAPSRVAGIESDLSDPHNGGHSVKIVTFEGGSRVVYKPKDLRADAAWHALVERLNGAKPPLQLKAARAIACEGYGWTEFIDHLGCANEQSCERFFRHAGAWLALFHQFAATDMHQENMIAAGEHPVPIDLEMILQDGGSADGMTGEPESQAVEAAQAAIADSVMAVGLLPAYGRSADNAVFAVGGMTAEWNAKIELKWTNINSDEMRPITSKEVARSNPNLPHVGGRYARFADHIDSFIAGFEDYAMFLRGQSLFDGFAGVPVRKVIRPTKFYDMLLTRLKNHKTMDDGAVWSAQADFMARLADWENDNDPLWPLQRAERAALVALNVPHFVSPSDGCEIRDGGGATVPTSAVSGLERAHRRFEEFDEPGIAWQITVMRENLSSLQRSDRPVVTDAAAKWPLPSEVTPAIFLAEADKIAEELSKHAIRKGPGAAWIGLDWLGDSEVFQLSCLGPDLYNGASGIALFLAAHAAVSGHQSSAELARAGVAQLRKSLKRRNVARMARAYGIGGASGLGSIVYALAVTAKSLADKELLADAHAAAALISDELIAADKRLDVMGGSAGAILGLLRLYRDSQSADTLRRATKCGEHLLGQPRAGPDGRRVWSGQGAPPHGLNGMSHGAAGFAYALAALAAATAREDFVQAAAECVAFEDASYDSERHNWPDLRGDKPAWPCQWCHGAPGIGLARIAMTKRGAPGSRLLMTDIGHALAGAEQGWPGPVDTLCCGALGSIEFFCEAAGALGRNDLRELAARRLAGLLQAASSAGDFRWNSGNRQFNLGLFRGLAGVGYTALRQVDASLPNVLIWE